MSLGNYPTAVEKDKDYNYPCIGAFSLNKLRFPREIHRFLFIYMSKLLSSFSTETDRQITFSVTQSPTH